MTRKRRRLYALGAGMLALFVAAGLALSAFEDTLVFFYSPSDIIADRPPPAARSGWAGWSRRAAWRGAPAVPRFAFA